MSNERRRDERWRTAVHLAAGLLACALMPVVALADDKPARVALDVRAAPHDGYGRLVFQAHDAGAAVVQMTAALDGLQLRIVFASPVSARLDAARTMLAGYFDGLVLSADGTTVTATLKHPVELKSQKINANIELVDFYDRKPEAVASAAPAQPQQQAEKPAAPVQPVVAVKVEPPHSMPATVTVGRAPDKALQVRFTPRDDGVSIRFEWTDPTPAAVFRRAGAVWAVFERTQTVDFSEFQPSLWPLVPAIAQVPSDGGTAIRLEAAAGYRPSVSRSGNAWVIELTHQASTIGEPVQPAIRRDGVTAAIELATAGPAGPVSFTDPAVGDTLVAVPLPEVGMAVAQDFDYPDLRVFDSAQGLAFHPLSDGLAVHIVRGKVEVTAPEGLMLAANQDRAPSPVAGTVLHATSWQGRP